MQKTFPITKIFKALSDDTRISILGHVLREKEVACQELMKRYPLSQPTMSHHFNKLVNAGVLHNRKDGVLWFYTLNFDYLNSLGIDIKKIILCEEKLEKHRESKDIAASPIRIESKNQGRGGGEK